MFTNVALFGDFHSISITNIWIQNNHCSYLTLAVNSKDDKGRVINIDSEKCAVSFNNLLPKLLKYITSVPNFPA